MTSSASVSQLIYPNKTCNLSLWWNLYFQQSCTPWWMSGPGLKLPRPGLHLPQDYSIMRPSTNFWSQRRLAISDSQYHLSLIRRCSYFPYSLACLRFHFESLLQKNTNNLGKIDRKRAIRIISMKLQPFIFDDVYDGPTPWKCTFLEEVQRMEFMFRAKTGFITLLSNTIHV